jgi:hypothetical protein
MLKVLVDNLAYIQNIRQFLYSMNNQQNRDIFVIRLVTFLKQEGLIYQVIIINVI